jgi:hypothetical protein
MHLCRCALSQEEAGCPESRAQSQYALVRTQRGMGGVETRREGITKPLCFMDWARPNGMRGVYSRRESMASCPLSSGEHAHPVGRISCRDAKPCAFGSAGYCPQTSGKKDGWPRTSGGDEMYCNGPAFRKAPRTQCHAQHRGGYAERDEPKIPEFGGPKRRQNAAKKRNRLPQSACCAILRRQQSE